ncbi:hypothetical protein NMY22_g13465 [Coprinellus aureogranulatus]|nr:hypothetical protein NMY22_g13465 [Coprinellus aureogranulatus]
MPIDDLPNEVLLLVFKELVELPSPSFNNPPSRVAEVCRRWNSLALSVSNIRSIAPLVDLDIHSRTLNFGGGHQELPFALAIRNVSDRNEKKECVRTICDTSGRWFHVEIFDVSVGLAEWMSSKLTGRIPLLHTLKLRLDDSEDDYTALSDLDAPSLCRLEVEYNGELALDAPFQQLEEYVERSANPWPYANLSYDVISDGSKLKSISLGYVLPMSTSNPFRVVDRSTLQTLPHLTTLNLYLPHLPTRKLLAWLTLPSLNRLRVVSNSPDVLETVHELIYRSQCSLTTLSIRLPGWNPLLISSQAELTRARYIAVLYVCPQLRNLELDVPTMITLNEILCPWMPSFLPHLRELVAHLPNAPSSPLQLHGEGSQVRKVPFVRLIFPTAEARAQAHEILDYAIPVAGGRKLDKRLKEVAQLLVSSPEALDDCLAYLESPTPTLQDPWQVLLSRIYVHLDTLRLTVPLASNRTHERIETILAYFNALLGLLNLGWRSENDLTLMRTGSPSPGHLCSLLDAEGTYPDNSGANATSPPWGFIDLTRPIGSS